LEEGEDSIGWREEGGMQRGSEPLASQLEVELTMIGSPNL